MDTPYRLLIVEDEPDTGSMLEEYFNRLSYQVFVAVTGQEAIDECHRVLPDLILLDVHLPDMDGYEVYARVQQLFWARHVPVIFFTQRPSRNDKLTGLELGAVGYLPKPFDLEELALRVRNALGEGIVLEESSANSVALEYLRPFIGGEDWAVLYLRLQNLDVLNGSNDASIQGQVLRIVADTLGSVARGGCGDSIIHLNRSDFVLLTSPEWLDVRRQEVVGRLSHAFQQLVVSDPAGGSAVSTTSVLSVWLGQCQGAAILAAGTQDENDSPGARVLLLEPLSLTS